jgi:hypothetical protein
MHAETGSRVHFHNNAIYIPQGLGDIGRYNVNSGNIQTDGFGNPLR